MLTSAQLEECVYEDGGTDKRGHPIDIKVGKVCSETNRLGCRLYLSPSARGVKGGWVGKSEEGCREGPPSPPLPSYAGLTQKELITPGWPKMRQQSMPTGSTWSWEAGSRPINYLNINVAFSSIKRISATNWNIIKSDTPLPPPMQSNPHTK